jgi:hypothetical protein
MAARETGVSTAIAGVMNTAGVSRGGGSAIGGTSAEAALFELLGSQGLSIYHGASISGGYETLDDVRSPTCADQPN